MQAIIGNPAPAAATITVAGEVEIFMPENDPGSAVDSAGDLESALRPYQFGNPLPRKVGLRVLVATPKALLKVPFRLTNVPFQARQD